MADEEEPTQSFAQQPEDPGDNGIAALRAELDKLHDLIADEANKLNERVDKAVREALDNERAERHDGESEQHNTEKLRLDLDELARRIKEPEPAAAGTTSTGGRLQLWNLTQDGGLAGGASVRCTFTYSATDYFTGFLIGTAMAPAAFGLRVTTGTMDAGGLGLGFFDDEGNPHLLIVLNELFHELACTPPP